MSPESRARSKSTLRLQSRAARRAITPEMRESASAAAAREVLELPEMQGVRTVAAYGAMPEEIDATPLIDALWAAGIRVALPRVIDQLYVSLHWYAKGDRLCRGAFGLGEPCADAPAADPEEIDLFIVPGVAFDAACNRLGMGAGYYDRLLGGLARDVPVVGIAYDEQVVRQVPCSEHDRPMDVLCTPTCVYRRP